MGPGRRLRTGYYSRPRSGSPTYLAAVVQVEHVVSGVALNILAYGSSRFMARQSLDNTTSPHVSSS